MRRFLRRFGFLRANGDSSLTARLRLRRHSTDQGNPEGLALNQTQMHPFSNFVCYGIIALTV